LHQNLKVTDACDFGNSGQRIIAHAMLVSTYPFLNSANDDELVVKSAKELESILSIQLDAVNGNDLLDMVASGCGLSPLLRLELFIVGTICHKVVHEQGYRLTAKRRERFIGAFLRSVNEAEEMKRRQWEEAEARRGKRLKDIGNKSSMCIIS
jgi:hypothetical protein